MESKLIIYKGHSIGTDIYLSGSNKAWFMDGVWWRGPSSVEDLKLYLDGLEYPKEFNSKLEGILNE